MISSKIRLFDILFSIIMLIIFFPIMIIISFIIIIFDGSPIIFKQRRIGYNGKKFTIFKFRTMSESLAKDEKLRLTKFGKILRKSSLDELPQLFNVLIKDMSLVGPRPLPEKIEEKIIQINKKRRRQVLPGITGISQINFKGKRRSLSEKISLDIEYIDNYSLYTYFCVIIKTPLVLIYRFLKTNLQL